MSSIVSTSAPHKDQSTWKANPGGNENWQSTFTLDLNHQKRILNSWAVLFFVIQKYESKEVENLSELNSSKGIFLKWCYFPNH